MDIVLKLRELRRMRHLSQEQAARCSGVGVKSISSFESGARIDSIKLLQLLALLKAYEITPAEFFGSKVEVAIFAEMERLVPDEATLVHQLRELPDHARCRLLEKIVVMIETARALSDRPFPATR